MNEILSKKSRLVDELTIFGLSLSGLAVIFFAWVIILIAGESSMLEGVSEGLVKLFYIFFVLVIVLAGFLAVPLAVFIRKKQIGYCIRIVAWEVIFVFFIKVFTVF